MLLQELRKRPAAGLPPAYQRRAIRYVIDLALDGAYLGAVDTSSAYERRGRRFVAPTVKRTSAIRPILFADGADYLLGIAADERRPGDAMKRAAAHLYLARACAAQTGLSAVAAAVAFLERVQSDRHLRDRVVVDAPDDAADLTIRVGENLLIDLPEVQSFWASTCARPAAGDLVPCLVCGALCSPVEVWPVKIKRLPGGQSSGTDLVSGNDPAFESYGIPRAATSATCAACAEHIGNALNTLLADPESHFNVGAVTYVFWAAASEHFDLMSVLSRPEPDQIKALLAAPLTARVGALVADTGRFFAVALSSSGSRIVVRDWLETTIPMVRLNVSRYFASQRIVGWQGEEPRPIGLFQLLRATVRDPKDLPPEQFRDLFRAILSGMRTPPTLMAAVVRRARSGHEPKRPLITTEQAALLKLTLIQEHDMEDAMTRLETDRKNPAYLCGRLLATLEEVQRAALGYDISATVVDRFFGTASSAPASVFGNLLRGAQPHLSKLRRTRPGAARALEDRITEIASGLPERFPATLNLQQQAVFCLGYYHERAHSAAERARHRAAASVTSQEDQ